MKARLGFHNRVVAALLPLLFLVPPAQAADPARLEGFYQRLKDAAPDEAARIEAEIRIEWAKSGSPAFDLLLQRGTDALDGGDYRTAAEHFTALLDQDPGFVEARASRAMAYFMAGEVGPALADLAQVLQEDPRRFDALAGVGTILEETGDKPRALAAYRAAAAIHPHMPDVNDAIVRLAKELEGQEL